MERILSRIRRVWPLAVLFALCVVLFAPGLVGADPPAVAGDRSDLEIVFAPLRGLSFGEISRGNFPLWNPYQFCGMPLFGSFQSALLYPPNLIFIVLPLTWAVNVTWLLHLFLAGGSIFAWARRRGISRAGAFVSAAIFTFCGPFYSHIYAGHLPHFAAMAWMPLILLATDEVLRRPAAKWVLVASGGFAMQVLAGFPQYVYYTGLAVVIYSFIFIITRAHRDEEIRGGDNALNYENGNPADGNNSAKISGNKNRAGWKPRVAAVAAIAVLGASMSAVQLLPGMYASAESVRSEGLTPEETKSFSMPPENLATIVAGGIYGNVRYDTLYGRWLDWETTAFVGLAGFILAIAGIAASVGRIRWVWAATSAFFLYLAAAPYLPFYKVLFYIEPFYRNFRGHGRAAIVFAIFASLAAGIGFDRLKLYYAVKRDGERASAPRLGWVKWAFLASGAIFLTAGTFVLASSRAGENGVFAGIISEMRSWPGSVYLFQDYWTAEFFARAGNHVSAGFYVGGAVAILCAAAFFAARRRPKFLYLIAGLVAAEMVFFAYTYTYFLPAEELEPPPGVAEFLSEDPGDYRILTFGAYANDFMPLGIPSLCGHESLIPGRYARIVTETQDAELDKSNGTILFRQSHDFFRALRVRYIILPESFEISAKMVRVYADEEFVVLKAPEDLPIAFLAYHWKIAGDFESAYAEMHRPRFPFGEIAVLEEDPGITPQPRGSKGPGKCEVLDYSTDSLTVEVEATRDAILVVTDNYAKGWTVEAVGESPQDEYRIIPAYYCLRGIPLKAGSHKIRLTYVTPGFKKGIAISLFSFVIWLCLLGWVLFGRRFVGKHV